jgi:uncharacterized MAPEG superfamily protein
MTVWYIRAMRAHANCVENLPVFGAIVFGLYVGNVASAFVNALAVAFLVARIRPIQWHPYASGFFSCRSSAFCG